MKQIIISCLILLMILASSCTVVDYKEEFRDTLDTNESKIIENEPNSTITGTFFNTTNNDSYWYNTSFIAAYNWTWEPPKACYALQNQILIFGEEVSASIDNKTFGCCCSNNHGDSVCICPNLTRKQNTYVVYNYSYQSDLYW